ncbi:hypothetical protein MASR1M101_28880 [Gemmatimonas sp.]
MAPTSLDITAADSKASGQSTAAVNRDLATLRNALARFHSFEAANRVGGYTSLFDGKCFEAPGVGGMGLHYVNGSLVDATIELERPEALLFEPGPGNAMVLVGVEYVIDPATWDASNKARPQLFGREYSYNDVYGLYTLHVWTHKNNPSGTFEGWNPKVSCDNWLRAKAGSHH